MGRGLCLADLGPDVDSSPSMLRLTRRFGRVSVLRLGRGRGFGRGSPAGAPGRVVANRGGVRGAEVAEASPASNHWPTGGRAGGTAGLCDSAPGLVLTPLRGTPASVTAPSTPAAGPSTKGTAVALADKPTAAPSAVAAAAGSSANTDDGDVAGGRSGRSRAGAGDASLAERLAARFDETASRRDGNV